jgi:hypothetical protein
MKCVDTAFAQVLDISTVERNHVGVSFQDGE